MPARLISKTIINILLFLCFTSFWIFAADLSADTILDSLTSVLQPEASHGKMEQEIITSSHVKHVFTFEALFILWFP